MLCFNNNKGIIVFKSFKEVIISNNKNVNNNRLFIIQIMI